MNLAHIIDDHAADRVALITRGRNITFGDLRNQVDRVRGGFAAAGIGTGDRIAISCGNGATFVVAYLAAAGLGAIVVPLNPQSPARELETELAAVGAKAIVVGRSGAATWANVDRASVPSVATVFATKDVTAAGDGEIAWEDLLGAEPVPVVERDPSDVAVLIFTSGTAGSPRAAMLTHGNLLASLVQRAGEDAGIVADDVVYGVLPLYHIFGLNIMLGRSLHMGATLVLVQRFDPATALDTIRERKVTIIPGAPAMWTAFAHFDEAPDDAFATVRLALSGAARLPVRVAEAMRDRFGVEISEGYGLTEASPTVTTSVGVTPRFGSVGRAVPGVEVRLVTDDGEALVGDVGEIWVRGENVFVGYWEDPEATANVLTPDGWLKTGDMATADDDGYLYLVDRSKDLIIVSGFNVYPAEVENALASHPDVVEVAVIGVPHPHTGEAVKAYVVARAGSDVDEDALIDHTRDRLARYKCPSKVLFVEELPRNATGKVVRRRLDDQLSVS